MRTSKLFTGLAGLATALVAVSPALAQDSEASGPVTISGGATVVSDYRFRGVSLSGEDAAIQGSLTATHESGLYAGVWGSSLADGTSYGSTELDFIAGWGGDVGGVTLDVNATYYYYPNQAKNDGTKVNYIEFLASASKDFGPVNVKLGAGFTPKQKAYGDFSGFYLYNDYALGIPNTPLTLKAHVGYNKSDFLFDTEYLDYSVGAEASWKALTFGVSYVNTTMKPKLVRETVGADGTVLFTLGAAF